MCNSLSEMDSSVEVPVLHVICHKIASPEIADIPEPHNVRRELIDWMSEHALGGDDLVAEWLLLQLTSKVSVADCISVFLWLTPS